MNLDEVVGEVSQSNGRDMVLDLFREGVSQSGKPACCHPYAKIVTLDIAGVDVFRVGLADDSMALATKANSGALALPRACGFDQHRVVHITRKRFIDCLDVHLQAV